MLDADVDNSLIFSLSNCNLFNRLESGQKYEHEWSHNLSSFYEFILYDPEVKTLRKAVDLARIIENRIIMRLNKIH